MKSIELFTGAGGLALGIHLAGFEHSAVVEWDHASCNTLRHNRDKRQVSDLEWPVFECNVSDFSYKDYPKNINLLAGGAPCQPFSLGGKHLGHQDERNMFPEIFRAVRELQPQAFLLENVRGLTRESFKPYFDYIISQLMLPFVARQHGESWENHKKRIDIEINKLVDNGSLQGFQPSQLYDVKYQVCSVADFGIPQDRQRVFIVGFRKDLGVSWSFPKQTHSLDALLYSQYVDGSYWRQHNLEPRPVPERWKKRVNLLEKHPKPTHLRWLTVRDAISDLPEPIIYDSSPTVDNHVGIPDARIYNGHTGSDWDLPAKTIKAGDHGNPGGENMLRREDGSVRYFTTRELARLQTFPDNWEFKNSWTENRRQLGNAVPVKMAMILANSIKISLEHATTGIPNAVNHFLEYRYSQTESWFKPDSKT